SPEVVVVEPAGQRRGALGRVAVDRPPGPLVPQRADEAFGLAVGAGPIRLDAGVTDPQLPAGQRVHGGAVAGAVVAHHALDPDPHRGEPRDRPAQKARGALAPLVGQDLDVGEAGRVVDRDVAVLPAGAAAPARDAVLARVDATGPHAAVAAHAMAGHDDAPELLHV